MEASPPSSDPILTANVYCAGRLDEVLHQVVAPCWDAIRQLDPDSGAYFWTMRSSKGGEHLKVCLHGPGSLAHPARVLLQQAADAFFAARARHGEPANGAVSNDVDNETGSDHPDRSLFWTLYRRNRASLGPFLDDDGYVSRITRCLAAACERVLLLEPDSTGRISHPLRQGALLAGLAVGLAAPGFDSEARPAYLAYHRDLLLRFPLARDQDEACSSNDLLRLFDRQIEAMGPAASALRRATRSEWLRDPAKAEPRVDAAWRRTLANLLWYVRPLCDDPDRRVDPPAADACFVPLFKVFHGLANQLGLSLVEEAYAHHLLWSVTDGEASRPAMPAGVGSVLELD